MNRHDRDPRVHGGLVALALIAGMVFAGGPAAHAQDAASPPAAAPPSAPPPSASAPPASPSPAPGSPSEAPLIAPVPGQLTLSEQQRQQIRRQIEADNPDIQPVPRAFAPAVGMTTPPELRLKPVPAELQSIPGISRQHHYVMLKSGTLMIVGDRRLVTAMIGPAAGASGSR